MEDGIGGVGTVEGMVWDGTTPSLVRSIPVAIPDPR
jgi:hypothetical protein